MKIAVDVDGVISNTIPLIIENIEKRGFRVVFDKYNPAIVGIDDREAFMSEVVQDVYTNQMDELKPYDDAVTSIPKIIKDVGSIMFVTARREKFIKPTFDWLDAHFDASFKLVHMSSGKKPQFILDRKFDAFIEDRLRTANSAAELGIKIYLINRPWNVGRPVHSDVIRIDSLEEFYLMEK